MSGLGLSQSKDEGGLLPEAEARVAQVLAEQVSRVSPALGRTLERRSLRLRGLPSSPEAAESDEPGGGAPSDGGSQHSAATTCASPEVVPAPRHNSKFESLDLILPYNARERATRATRALHSRRARWGEEFVHYFTAVLIGLCLGMLGVAFHQGYAQLAKLRMEGYFHFAEQRQWGLAFAVNSVISIAYLILPCAATLWRPAVGGSGIPGLLAFLNGVNIPTLLTWPVLLLKFVGSVFAVGSGLALGPEGPAIHIGACFGSLFCQFWYGVVRRAAPGADSGFERKRQHFTALGAGAGVAAVFRAPLAGTLFVIEEAASQVNIRNIWATFVASVTAFATVYAIEYGLEDHGTFLFSITQGDACGTFLPVEYFFFAMLGVACGLVGAAFNWMQRWLNQLRAAHMNRSRLTRIAELLAISLLTSAAAVFYPLLYPCQDATAQALLRDTNGCMSAAMQARTVQKAHFRASVHHGSDVTFTLEPGFFGLQYSEDCTYAIDYDTCRSGGNMPFQNCTIPMRPPTESRCYLPGIETWTDRPLLYCCGFRTLAEYRQWADTNGTEGYVYGYRRDATGGNGGGTYYVVEPHLTVDVDQPSRSGSHYCDASDGVAQYSPAAMLASTGLGANVAHALFKQGMPYLFPFGVMLAYLAIYFILANLTSGAATPGGLIVPFVIMGGLIGRLMALFFMWAMQLGGTEAPTWLAAVWHPLLHYVQSDFYTSKHPHMGIEVVPYLPDPGAYAIAGAAAFMAGTGRLSLFFTVIMMESTGYVSFALPIFIGAIFATWTGNLFNHGLYHILMEIAKMPYLPRNASIDQAMLQVKDLCEGHPVIVARPSGSIRQWLRRLESVRHNAFPVVDLRGRMLGVVQRRVLERHLQEQARAVQKGEVTEAAGWPSVYERVVEDMDSAPVTVRENDPVDHALLIFTKMRLRHLVVLDGERPTFLLTRHDLHPHAITHKMALNKTAAMNLSTPTSPRSSPLGHPPHSLQRVPSDARLQDTTQDGSDGHDNNGNGDRGGDGMAEADDVFDEGEDGQDVKIEVPLVSLSRRIMRKMSLNFVT